MKGQFGRQGLKVGHSPPAIRQLENQAGRIGRIGRIRDISIGEPTSRLYDFGFLERTWGGEVLSFNDEWAGE